MTKVKKVVLAFLLLILCILVIFSYPKNDGSKMVYGVTFSKPFAQFMGLDWRETYLAILDDLKVKRLRLPSYWTEVEPAKRAYTFGDLDWQIQEAGSHNAEVVLVLGQKQPRWPECHIPDWAKNLDKDTRQQEVLGFITKVVERYKDDKNITAWKVENEPYFHFGECPPTDDDFINKEVALVRSLDSRPIVITDSGELNSWYRPAKLADILGTTMYRIVWNKNIGYIKYPIPSIFYRIKANMVKYLTGVKTVVIMELQAEPWGGAMPNEMSLDEQFKSMNPEQFRGIISYAQRTGFSESYLWGAEWWYWLKKTKGNDSMWNEAKKVFDPAVN